jgi:hypothetical protein
VSCQLWCNYADMVTLTQSLAYLQDGWISFELVSNSRLTWATLSPCPTAAHKDNIVIVEFSAKKD